jgi:putative membrane protein
MPGKGTTMKTAKLSALFSVAAAGVLALAACQVDEPWATDRTGGWDDDWVTDTDDWAERPADMRREQLAVVAGRPDLFFMMQASHFNDMVTELSRIAVNRASTQQVRDFAQMMIDDHAQLERELQSTARNMRVDLPARPDWARQAPRLHLQALNGWDFDEEYTNLMIADHARAVAIYENALRRTTDSNVRNLAENGLPMMRRHLEHARTTSAALGDNPTNRPG